MWALGGSLFTLLFNWLQNPGLSLSPPSPLLHQFEPTDIELSLFATAPKKPTHIAPY